MRSMKKVYGIIMLLVGVLFISAESYAQYCTPNVSGSWDGISEVKTSGGTINISKTTSVGAAVRNYTGTDSIATNYGQTFTITAKYNYALACWIDWNDDGDFADAGEKIGGPNPASSSSATQTHTYTVTVPNNAAYGQLRMRLYSCYYYYIQNGYDNAGCGYSSYQGEVEDYRIWIPEPKKNDAGITELIPAAPCAGSIPVQVRVTNFGLDTMKSVTVSGSIKQVGGATINYGPTVLTGLSLARLQDTLYTVTNYTIVKGNTYDFEFSTSLPNGSTDSTTANDKITRYGAAAALGGTYTIGASSSADYNTFKAAEADMKAYGICAATVFNVEAGTYNEQVKFTTYTGISATNNVRFRAHPSNTAPVRLTYSSSSSTDRGTVIFTGTEHIAMDSITIEARGSSYANVIQFASAPKNLSFTGDSLLGNRTSTTTSNYMAIVYDYQTKAENITVQKSVLLGGSCSFYIYGGGSTSQTGGYYKIEDNIMGDWNYMGLYMYYRQNNDVNRNVIWNSGRYNYPRGIQAYYCNNTSVSGNDIQLKANNYAYGIYHYRCYGSSSNRQMIQNNMVAVTGGTGYHYLLYAYYANYTDIDFNSLSNEKGNSYQTYIYYGTSVTFRNNIIANFGTGYRYRMYGSQTKSHNVWWAPTASSANGNLGTNVLNVDPKYKSITDLHSRSTQIHNSGLAVTGVTTDIDGDTRCPGTGCPGTALVPDRGADEFWLPDYDISPVTAGASPCVGSQSIQIYVSNIGLKPLTSFTVNWSIGGVAQTPLVVSSSNVGAGVDTLVTLGSHTFVSGTSYNFEYITSSPSGQTDQQMFNDTLRETLQNAMAGTFTVGSGGDYPGLVAAIADVIALGMCGPVVLHVMDSTFVENVTISNITGNSSSNTLTIIARPSNTNDAIVDGGFIVNDVTHVTIEGLVINTTGNAIEIGSGTITNLTIKDNEINVPIGSSGYGIYDGTYGANTDSLKIIGNTITGGYSAVRLYGGGTASGSKEKNAIIDDNIIKDWYYAALYLYYCKDVSVQRNNMENLKGTYTYPYGIMYYYSDAGNIRRNKMNIQNASGSYGGIYTYRSNYYGTTADTTWIVNNSISIGYKSSASGTSYGMRIYYYNYRMQVLNNSVHNRANGYGMYTYYYTRYSNFRNNIISTEGATTWYDYLRSTGFTYDYNAYWNGTGHGLSGITMASNDVATNPRFKNVLTNLLIPNSFQIDSGGTNVGVGIDINGVTRTSPPDIGAYEFAPCYFDAVAKEYYARYKQIPNNQSVRVYGTVGNSGLDTITGVAANGVVGSNTVVAPLGSILSDRDSSFSVAVPLTGVLGVVNASMYTTLTETDCYTPNDSAFFSFTASDSVYAYDDSTVNNRLGYNPPFTGEFGNVFEIFNTDTITTGTFYLDGPNQGATVRLLVYHFIDSTGLPGAIIDSTRNIIIGKSGTGWYTLQFGCGGVIAQPGKYLVTIEQSNPVRMELGIDVNGTGVAGTRWERGTGGSWSDLYASSSVAVQNAVLALRVNLGTIQENDVLPATSLICNNSSTYLKLNKKYTRQLWSNGLLFDSILVSNPGVYKVTAWDEIGCVFTDSTSASKATPMVVTSTPAKATCGMSDGSVALSVVGSYPPHTYSWDNGATTQNLSNVSGNDYSVVVTDSLGCQNTQTVQVLGAFPVVSGDFTYPTCNGDNNGTASASVMGVKPYSYSWNAGGSPSSATNTNLTSGSYVVDVTDASGCVTKDTVVVKDPAVLVTNNVVVAPTACKLADASAEAQMSGGLAPYNFLWSDGQTSGKAVGLTEGVYDVTITDSLGCVVISKMRVSDPNTPTAIPNDQLLDCSYDTTTVKVNVLAGTGPFTYTWSYKNMKTSTISGVSAGNYKLHLVDSKGCDHDTTVVISAPTEVKVNFDNLVDSAGIAKATATTTGGSPAYSWSWAPSGETTERAVKLKNGVNKVTVVDAKGCSFTYQLDVEITTTSVSYLNNPAVFNIYPNPTDGNVFVDLNLNTEDDVKIRVLNSLGKVVQVIEKDNVIQDKIAIDLNDFSVGIYLVETTIGSEKIVSRIQLTK